MVRIIDNYTLYESVGEGSYGKVYRAINRIDKKQYAVKVIEARKFNLDRQLEEYTVNEINILSNMDKTPHIIQYYDMLRSQTNFYFVYQYCNQGTLHTLITKHKRLSEKQALKVLRQLIEAFKILYKFNVVHRDLKPENIFFKDGLLKLGDFGFCKSLEKTKMTKTMLGSPIYMAPEVLKEQVYSSKADIWSLGVVLFEMLYGYCPFESSSIPKLLKVLNSCEVSFPENVKVSNECKDLIKRLLTKNSKTRMDWLELFEIQISAEGVIVTQDNKVEMLKKARDPRITLNQTSTLLVRTNKSQSNRSLGKGRHDVAPRAKRLQTQPDNEKQETPKQQISPTVPNENKLHVIQEDTDDESHKNKLLRRNKAFCKIKSPTHSDFNQNYCKTTTGSFQTYLKRVTSGEQVKAVFHSKQKVLLRHTQIIQGNSIARNLQHYKQRNSNLFSYLLYRTVLSRLTEFRKQLEQQGGFQDILNLVISELDELHLKIKNLEASLDRESFACDEKLFQVQVKKYVRQNISECKHLRLGYEMTMFLMNQSFCGGLNNEQMTRIINLKLI